MSKLSKVLKIATVVAGATFVGLSVVAKLKKSQSVYRTNPEEKNPLEGKKVIFKMIRRMQMVLRDTLKQWETRRMFPAFTKSM